MTDLRTAAQQALEAMDKATRYMSFSDHRKLNEAIAALKAALEQPEQEPVAKYSDIVSDGGMDPRNKFDHPHRNEANHE